jgi:hypothetical protein
MAKTKTLKDAIPLIVGYLTTRTLWFGLLILYQVSVAYGRIEKSNLLMIVILFLTALVWLGYLAKLIMLARKEKNNKAFKHALDEKKFLTLKGQIGYNCFAATLVCCITIIFLSVFHDNYSENFPLQPYLLCELLIFILLTVYSMTIIAFAGREYNKK